MLTSVARCLLLAATVTTLALSAAYAPPDAAATWYLDVTGTVAAVAVGAISIVYGLDIALRACRAIWQILKRVRLSLQTASVKLLTRLSPTRPANKRALAESVGRPTSVGGPWASLGNPGRAFDPPQNFPTIKSSAIRVDCQRNAPTAPTNFDGVFHGALDCAAAFDGATCSSNRQRRFFEPPEVASAFAASMRAKPDVGRRIGVDEIWTGAVAFCQHRRIEPPSKVAFLRELAEVPGVRRRSGDRIVVDDLPKKTTTYTFRPASKPALVIARRQPVDKLA
jgi:hypothetical protein